MLSNQGNQSLQLHNRLEWIDVAKAICMIFVMYSHTGYAPSYMVKLYTPFFLTAFFFISGYFFLNSSLRIDNVWQKLLNIFTSLLIPYILYWFISFAVDSCIHGNYFFFDDWCWHVLMGDKLWFVSALIIAELLTLTFVAVCQCLTNKRGGGVILLPILSFLIYQLLPDANYPWYIKPAFLAAFYMGIGVIVRQNELLDKITSNHLVGISSLCLLLFLWLSDCVFQIQEGYFSHGFKNIYFFILQSGVSIMALLYICRVVFIPTRLLRFIGLYSLLFYFYQNQILNVTKFFGKQLNVSAPSMWYSIASTIVVTLVLVIPVWLTAKYLPVLAGKWRVQLKAKV